jgi:hypothetical protein
VKKRIAAVAENAPRAMGAYHPAGTAATPMTMPTSRTTYTPAPGYPWGTLGYEDLHPVWSADGAAYVPAADNGSWGQARAAGRPRHDGWT